MTARRRIGILTGGGDCPGLNAVIRAVWKTAANVHDWEVWGVRNGFEGFLEPRGAGVFKLEREHVAGILPQGGTILGASNRCNIFAVPDAKGRERDRSDRVVAIMKQKRLSALITVGGDGTQRMAHELMETHGVPIVGVPKTIDNDLPGTDRTFGFDTAVGIVTEAIDRLYTTTESHQRVMIVEVMGRHAGWIALHGGLAAGSEVILIPEIPYDPDRIAARVQERIDHGVNFSIITVAEGAKSRSGGLVYRRGQGEDPITDRLGGVSFRVAEELRQRTSLEVRNIVLGHMQRGGTPSSFDRILASGMGVHAIHLIADGKLGHMVALKSGKMSQVSMARAAGRIRKVDPRGQLVQTAREMGISFAAANGSDDPYDAARREHGVP